jgi:hypothetical protein
MDGGAGIWSAAGIIAGLALYYLVMLNWPGR